MTRNFAKDRRGNVGIIFAVTIIPVLSLVGGAIDYSNAMRLKQTMGAVVDAAALAAGSAVDMSDSERITLASDYITANMPEIGGATVGTPVITLSDNTVTITLSGSTTTTILGVAGMEKIDVAVETEATVKDTKMEVALVLDTTGSMDSSGKIGTLRTATEDLINTLYDGTDSASNVKMAIVPFNTHVNISKTTLDPSEVELEDIESCSGWGWWRTCTTAPLAWDDWEGCVHARSGSAQTDDSDVTSSSPVPAVRCGIYDHDIYYDSYYKASELLPLTNSQSTLVSKATSLSAVGGTYIPIGLEWGWKVLSPNVPYTDPAAYNDSDWQKAMILMTDGENIEVFGSVSSANSTTSTLCENIKDAGITIYTVAFQITDSTTKTMMENCASKPAFYYDATNNAALTAAFSSIAEQLSQLRLSK